MFMIQNKSTKQYFTGNDSALSGRFDWEYSKKSAEKYQTSQDAQNVITKNDILNAEIVTA
jgi:hypothetical protein